MGPNTKIVAASLGGAAVGAAHEAFGTFVWYGLVPFPVRMGLKVAAGAVCAGLAQWELGRPAHTVPSTKA